MELLFWSGEDTEEVPTMSKETACGEKGTLEEVFIGERSRFLLFAMGEERGDFL